MGGLRGGLGNSCTQSDITISGSIGGQILYSFQCNDQCLTQRSPEMKENKLTRSTIVTLPLNPNTGWHKLQKCPRTNRHKISKWFSKEAARFLPPKSSWYNGCTTFDSLIQYAVSHTPTVTLKLFQVWQCWIYVHSGDQWRHCISSAHTQYIGDMRVHNTVAICANTIQW